MQTTREQLNDLYRTRHETYEAYEDGILSETEMEARIAELDERIEALEPARKEAAFVDIDIEMMRPEA